MDTMHRKRISIPIFCSSEHGTNLTSDGSNSIFEQHLEPSIAVPLAAKHPTMHLDQASVDYSITNVRAGVNDSVKLHLRNGVFETALSSSTKVNASIHRGLLHIASDAHYLTIAYNGDTPPKISKLDAIAVPVGESLSAFKNSKSCWSPGPDVTWYERLSLKRLGSN